MAGEELTRDLIQLGQLYLLNDPARERLGTSICAMLQDSLNACESRDWSRAEASARACCQVTSLAPRYRGMTSPTLVLGASEYFCGVAFVGRDKFTAGQESFERGADILAFAAPSYSAVLWLALARVRRELAFGEAIGEQIERQDKAQELFYAGLMSLQRSENLLSDTRETIAPAVRQEIDREHARFITLWKTRCKLT